MTRPLKAAALLLLALAASALCSPAQEPPFPEELVSERILDFRSEIAVARDGSMTVRETISVKSAGEQIKRGIYRDFPTRYRDRLGNYYTVGFEVLGALRDGQPETYDVENEGNGKRVYLGQEDVMLPPGDHTYTLSFRTTRQLGFFPDHDELYWNVTGNGWAFPIRRATAVVTLPTGIHRQAILIDGYTGPQGSLAKALESFVDGEGRPTVVTTKPLAPYEGLTIVVSWPKGFVSPPTDEMKRRWFFEDNVSTLVGLAGLALLTAYYFAVWVLVGRDPSRGVIVMHYEPPPGFSPAAVRYVTEMGFDHRTFAAAIISMAVNRFLRIEEKDGTYTLVRGKAGTGRLSPEESAVAGKLFASGDTLELKNTNHARINLGIEALKTWLRLNLEKIYFFTNGKYLVPGIIFSGVLVFVVALTAPGEQKFVACFVSVWLAGWSVGVFFLVSQVIQAWRGVFGGVSDSKAAAAGGATFLTLFSLPFLAGEVFAILTLGSALTPAVVVILLVVAAVNFAFHHLLKAPTSTGRLLLDKIEGFKMFLAAAGGENPMDAAYASMRTPDLYEKYLPYALALGVEEPWSEQFSEILSVAAQRGSDYTRHWYSGRGWQTLGVAAFAATLGTSFSSAISTSSTAPGSRSGSRSSGGSSGGGGGGGGGGGW